MADELVKRPPPSDADSGGETPGRCGTPLIQSGEIQLWGGYPSEAAMRAAELAERQAQARATPQAEGQAKPPPCPSLLGAAFLGGVVALALDDKPPMPKDFAEVRIGYPDDDPDDDPNTGNCDHDDHEDGYGL